MNRPRRRWRGWRVSTVHGSPPVSDGGLPVRGAERQRRVPHTHEVVFDTIQSFRACGLTVRTPGLAPPGTHAFDTVDSALTVR